MTSRRKFLGWLGSAAVVTPVLAETDWDKLATPVEVVEAPPALPPSVASLRLTDTSVSGDIADFPGLLMVGTLGELPHPSAETLGTLAYVMSDENNQDRQGLYMVADPGHWLKA